MNLVPKERLEVLFFKKTNTDYKDSSARRTENTHRYNPWGHFRAF